MNEIVRYAFYYSYLIITSKGNTEEEKNTI